MEFKYIVEALRTVKMRKISTESEIHDEIMKSLKFHNIDFIHEYRISPRKRFDFWIDGIVIEVKKRRPIEIDLRKQLDKYTREPSVKGMIVVMEKIGGSLRLPNIMNGKPIIILSLYRNWGVSV